MQTSAVLLGLVALSYSTLSAVGVAEPLPWDGRADGLTIDKLSDKYVTKVLTKRNGESEGSPADYVGPQWTARFKVDTWYNFGIGLKAAASGKGTELEFYTSVGNEDLALNVTTEAAAELPSSLEMHWGLLTQAKSTAGPVMTKRQEVMSFNGISGDGKVETAAAVSTTKPSTSSVAGEAEGIH
ncbi:unnamed protein product [Phytophthora lilii]|uniref:Unnamed protein product n=1 Tax=Phytophthora lilii TaxID=2077276 RepID=A0A9W6TNS9_9STRA|nr:unnamed protein product [Phytophthora lilii]